MYVQYYGTPGTESSAQIGHDSQAVAAVAAAAAASVKDSFQEDSRSSDDDDANVTRVDMAKNQNQLSNILHLSIIKILYDTQKTLGSAEDTIA